MTRRLIALFGILTLVLGLFAGCGDEESKSGAGVNTREDDLQEIQYAYKASYIPLEFEEDYKLQSVNSFCLSGDGLYLAASCVTGSEPYVDPITGTMDVDENGEPYEMTITEMMVFRLDLDTKAVTRLDYTEPDLAEGMEGGTYISSMTEGVDGTVWVVEQTYTYYFDLPDDFDVTTDDAYNYYVDGGMTCVCVQYSAQGAEMQRIRLELPADTYIGEVNVLADGTVFTSDWNCIYCFDGSGKNTGVIALDNGINMLVPLSDTQMGASVWTENGNQLQPIDTTSMTLGEGSSIPSNAYALQRGFGDYTYTYQSNGTIYGFRTGERTGTKLFSWLDCDVDSSNVGSSYAFGEDGTAYALERVDDEKYADGAVYNLLQLERVDASTLPQKETLTLACMYLDYDVRTKIITFNKSHDDVRIVVNDYSQYATDEDYYAGLQKLNTEILSGVVPDLFCAEGIPLDVYVAKGILRDLWPLIDSDPELSREDLMAHFFDQLSVDGKLYQVVDTFGIETVVGRSDVIGDAESWTLEELMAAYETLEPGASIFGEMDTKTYMLYNCIKRSSNHFVDWAAQQCSFDSQEFIDLLTFVNSFPAEFDYENYDWETYETEGIRMRTGKQLLQQVYLSSFEQLQNYYVMCDGKVNFIGYPTTSDSGSSFQVYGGLAISAACKNTEMAWEFIRQYLTEEHQTQEYMWNFPTNRHSFEAYAEQRMTPEYETDPETGEQKESAKGWYWFSEEEEIPIYAMTQEEYDLFMEVYEKTSGISTCSEDINEIIDQETEAFFAGQKTAEETADLIQNRASLYVFEQG